MRFKFNPNDLSQIWVYDEVENKFIEVKAINQQYTKGLSKWQHEVVINQSKRAKERVDAEALLESKAEINRIVETGIKELAKKRKSSARIAKWKQVSSNAEIMRGINTDANPLEIDNATKTSKTNISSADTGISDIGTCCDTSEPTNLDRISSGITIIESRQEDLTQERPAAANKRSNQSTKNGIGELRQIPKEETEFDLSGWGISSKAEESQKRHNKKSADSAATEEGDHGK